jgi:hypothetical protein
MSESTQSESTQIIVVTDEHSAHRRQLIEALRSDRYQQARSALRVKIGTMNGEPVFGYCCLGVAENERGCTWFDRATEPARYATTVVGLDSRIAVVRRWAPKNETSNYTTLSVAGQQWLGVSRSDPYVVLKVAGRWTFESLAGLNDRSGMTLAQIGDVLADQTKDWTGDYVQVSRRVRELSAP